MINLAIVVVHVEMGVTRLAIGAFVNQTDTSQFYWRSGAPVTYSSWVPQWDGNRLNGMYLKYDEQDPEALVWVNRDNSATGFHYICE